ncbi:MAG: hypothetical protein NTV65_07410 [Proteobacteria bacterium]|nr:hypothetical protein [Pseudomonadota bacterium]
MKIIFSALVVLYCVVQTAEAQLTTTGAQIVSTTIDGQAPSGASQNSAIAPNGDIIVFSSEASNLVADDNNQLADIFKSVKGVISLVSRGSSGGFPSGDSKDPAISPILPDGGYAIVFASNARDIVSGYQPPPPSGSLNPTQIYMRLEPSGETILISRALDASRNPVPLLGGNGESRFPSVTVVPSNPPKFMIGFLSQATNIALSADVVGGLIPLMVPFGASVKIQRDGLAVVEDIRTPRIRPDADCFDLVLSGNGSYLAFSSAATNLVRDEDFSGGFKQVFLNSMGNEQTFVLSRAADGTLGNGDSSLPSLSFRGDIRTFLTQASNLGGSTTNAVATISNSMNKVPTVINTSINGALSNGRATSARISPNGFYVAFSDTGTNLAQGPTGNFAQSYIKNVITGEVFRTSVTSGGVAGDDTSAQVSIGGAGFNSLAVRTSFTSRAFNLNSIGAGGTNTPIYRADIDVPPPPLTSGVILGAPPDIAITSRKATFTLQEFSDANIGSLSVGTFATSVKYNVEIRLARPKTRIIRNTTRNQITARKLSPGSYTVRYRVTGETSSGTAIKSKYSPKETFVIE